VRRPFLPEQGERGQSADFAVALAKDFKPGDQLVVSELCSSAGRCGASVADSAQLSNNVG
jgi:hypothetical protein